MLPRWKLLHCQNARDVTIPPLLVKYEFGISSYKVWVTDLTRVWSESLEQRPLIQRAWDIETDIDPIENDQRQLLLQKIKDSLNEVPGTRLALSRRVGSNGLQLTAFSPLPKPFKALQWHFYLASSTQLTLTNELLLPLLGEQLLFRKKIETLLEILSEKDHVIGKLTDKLQLEGIELGKVFPGAASSKSNRESVSREVLGKVVRGLGSFDKAQWQTRCTDELAVSDHRQDVFSQLFGPESSSSSVQIGEHFVDEAWWERMSGEAPPVDDVIQGYSQTQSQSTTANDFQASTSRSRHCRKLMIMLQRQSTPDPVIGSVSVSQNAPRHVTLPKRGLGSPKNKQGLVDDDSTTEASDEDLDLGPPKHSKGQQDLVPTIEGSSSSGSNSPEPARKPRQDLSSRPKGVLGNIGGASKSKVSPVKTNIGHIGGASIIKHSSKSASKSPEPKANLTKQPETPPSPRETSQDRADKKREQLKRELEEKSKLGVKKKRKF
ncbi:MAG: hypothetical protein L6R35_004015 [Caloplaca aegaea]|nr:MAG: hypothetical protein L6R35_004015 [Caloplaca aegaea]